MFKGELFRAFRNGGLTFVIDFPAHMSTTSAKQHRACNECYCSRVICGLMHPVLPIFPPNSIRLLGLINTSFRFHKNRKVLRLYFNSAGAIEYSMSYLRIAAKEPSAGRAEPTMTSLSLMPCAVTIRPPGAGGSGVKTPPEYLNANVLPRCHAHSRRDRRRCSTRARRS